MYIRMYIHARKISQQNTSPPVTVRANENIRVITSMPGSIYFNAGVSIAQLILQSLILVELYKHHCGIRFPFIEYYSIIGLIKVRATDDSIIFNINCAHERS